MCYQNARYGVKMFSIIAAIGKNNELGKKGQLVFHLKDDMKFFRETTTGHKVVMGHKTWNSLGGKLKNRTNIVVARENFAGPDLILSDLSDFITKNQHTDEEIFIIGGAMLYNEMLRYANNIYLTEIDATDADADTFFPKFDKKDYKTTVIKKDTENGIDYSIIKYIKK